MNHFKQPPEERFKCKACNGVGFFTHDNPDESNYAACAVCHGKGHFGPVEHTVKKESGLMRFARQCLEENKLISEQPSPARSDKDAERAMPDRMTERKTAEVTRTHGYQIVGYVMQKPGGDYCLSSQSAVRWLDQRQYWRLMHEQDGSLFAAKAQESAPNSELNGGMHASIFVKVWGDAGGGDAGRIALADYAYKLGQRAAGNAAPTEAVTRLDVLSLIREHGHRCYVAGVNCAEVEPKYMAEIEAALRSLIASNAATAEPGDLLREVADVLSENNWRGDLVEALRDLASNAGAATEVPTPCDSTIHKNGAVVAVLDAGMLAMEGLVKEANRSEGGMDWHYFGGRAVVKTLGHVPAARAALERAMPRFLDAAPSNPPAGATQEQTK